MEAVIARTRARLHTTLLDAEDQMKSLGDLMGAVRGGKGGSAIVFGQEEDERSAVVERALEQHGQGVSTQHLWLSRLGTESNALQTLLESEASREPRIIVVDSADDLVCKSKQALLYRLLDRAKTGTWLVLLIITNQDMIFSLEKRVRSRLPAVTICMGEEMGEEQWERLFERLMEGGEEGEKRKEKDGKENEEEKPVAPVKGPGRPKCAKKGEKKDAKKEEAKEVKEMKDQLSEEERVWAEYVRRFLADADVCRGKQKLYNYSGHIAVVKRALNGWLILMDAADVETAMNPSSDVAVEAFRRTVDDFLQVVDMCVPRADQISTVINWLPHRAFCMLVAAARRLRCNPAGAFAYGKIAVDFMHQCNSVDKRMAPDAELQTFKALDSLCELQLLKAVGDTHAHSFRQIRLNCYLPDLLTAVRAGIQKNGLRDWFESQPVT